MRTIPADPVTPTVAFDLDGTLAKWNGGRAIGAAIPQMVELARDYLRMGYLVVIYTARPEEHRPLINGWLQENGLYDIFHHVYTGKPRADLFVDDRAYNPWRTDDGQR